MNFGRVRALRNWFEKFGDLFDVPRVEGYSEYWRKHVPTISHFLESGVKVIKSTETAYEAYDKAYNLMKDKSISKEIIEQLKPEAAAAGDDFEIMKFLVAFLNEMRISCPDSLEKSDWMLDESDYEHIRTIFLYMDEQENWDMVDSWPAVLFQGNPLSDGLPTPERKHVRREYPQSELPLRRLRVRESISPLSDLLSSPKVREVRMLREKVREIEDLKKRCSVLEYERDDQENLIRELRKDIREIELDARQAEDQIRAKEMECTVLKRELEELKEEISIISAQKKQSDLKISDLIEQISSNKKILRQSDTTLQSANQRLEQSEQHLKSLNDRLKAAYDDKDAYLHEISLLQSSKNALIRKTEDEKAQFQQMCSAFELLVSSLRERVKELEVKHDDEVATECERSHILGTQLSELKQKESALSLQINERNERCAELEEDKHILSLKLNQTEKDLNQKIARLTHKIDNLNGDLKLQSVTYENKIRRLENNSSAAREECEKLSSALTLKNAETLDREESIERSVSEYMMRIENHQIEKKQNISTINELRQTLEKDRKEHILEIGTLQEKIMMYDNELVMLRSQLSTMCIHPRQCEKKLSHSGDLRVSGYGSCQHPSLECVSEPDWMVTSSYLWTQCYAESSTTCRSSSVRAHVTDKITTDDNFYRPCGREKISESKGRNETVPTYLRSTYPIEVGDASIETVLGRTPNDTDISTVSRKKLNFKTLKNLKKRVSKAMVIGSENNEARRR